MFTQLESNLTASAQASAQFAGVNAIPIGQVGEPKLRVVTLAVAGTGAGATVFLVCGASQSASASADWFVVPDSTMDATADPFTSIANFELPAGAFVGIVLASESVTTDLGVWFADCYT